VNDRQRTVLATSVVALLVGALFFVPWQREDSDEIYWSPFYRAPITVESTLRGSVAYNELSRVKGRPMFILYVVQLAGIAGTGLVAFRLARSEVEAS
jgi:hypothetical protein